MTAQIRIEGLDKVRAKIKSLEEAKPLKAALKASALHIKGEIAKYPPSSEANVPRTIAGTGRVLPWYERGWGTRYIGGGGRKTSETLGRRWSIKGKDGGWTQVIGNNVSYGEYVQGEKQASFHKRRGWKTTDDIVEQEAKTVNEFLAKAVKKILDE